MKLVYGKGVNDLPYKVSRYEIVNGKYKQVWKCPIYRKWHSMFSRCYDDKELEKHPSYLGCEVCPEWFSAFTFMQWVETQPCKDWVNRQLDKDFLSGVSKVYSPETCVFIPQDLNKFMTLRELDKSEFMLGVFKSSKNCYGASCNDGSGKGLWLGSFPDELSAHLAWVRSKLQSTENFLEKYKSEEKILVGLERLKNRLNHCLSNKKEFKRIYS